MEPCLEKEMVHHYECVDGRGWGSLNVGRNWWWVGLLGVYMHVCVCVCTRLEGGFYNSDGKIRFFFSCGEEKEDGGQLRGSVMAPHHILCMYRWKKMKMFSQ